MNVNINGDSISIIIIVASLSVFIVPWLIGVNQILKVFVDFVIGRTLPSVHAVLGDKKGD